MKNNFTFDFYVKRKTYWYYSDIRNIILEKNYPNHSKSDDRLLDDTVIVRYIHPYFEAVPISSIGVIKVYHSLGFLANLTGFSNLESYMKVQLSPKTRSRMRRLVRRLETCFPIRYKLYYGKISRQDYTFLLDNLSQMIKRRFLQRGDEHQALKHWGYLEANVYKMILEKKASLFVIYDNDKPIDICLNYHHQNIFRNYIRSYDIDYSKFRLGYIDIWKQLEWCFENDHSIFDLSIGDLAYKRTWCNTVYTFEHQILFSKTSYAQKIKAFAVSRILKLRWYLAGKKKLWSKPWQSSKSKKNDVKSKKAESFFIKENISPEEIGTLSLLPIDINSNKYAFLRKPTYDFQYLNSLPSHSVKVFQPKDENDVYIITGKTKRMKIMYHNTAPEYKDFDSPTPLPS